MQGQLQAFAKRLQGLHEASSSRWKQVASARSTAALCDPVCALATAAYLQKPLGLLQPVLLVLTASGRRALLAQGARTGAAALGAR